MQPVTRGMTIQQRGCSRRDCPIVHLHSPSLSACPQRSPCLLLPLPHELEACFTASPPPAAINCVCLWFYFSDDVTLNTFHVPFVIFTSKNDAFLQIHFSPISHNLMEQARLPACQERVSGPWLSHPDPQEHLEYTDSSRHLVYPRCPFGFLPKSFSAGPEQENRELHFYRNQPRT